AENVLRPRYLFLVVVPADVERWLTHSSDEIALRRCGFWLSLAGLPANDNSETVTVNIPSKNVLSPTSIGQLMTRARI
ncbi:MAG TPA: DUF4365 domain-containing protein, partial [Thermoanaerobaculia bacterium]|nr:DUF4365 domain-containing protein [Thermoanaerobaculia bacterium]